MSPIRRRRRSGNTARTSSISTSTLFSHGNFTETERQRETGYSSQASTDYVRPENLRAAANLRSEFRNLTMQQLEEQAETMPMGTADEVAERIIAAADSAGANQVQLALNRGCLPHELFMDQIERFAREVLPAPAGARSKNRAGRRGGDGVLLTRRPQSAAASIAPPPEVRYACRALQPAGTPNMRAALAFGLLAVLCPAVVLAQTSAAPSSSSAPSAASPARARGGNITRDEYIERAKRNAEKRFDRMDTDHDGILTPEERAAARSKRRSSKSE